MSDHIQNSKQHIIDNCIACGTCAKICPSIEVAQMGHVKPKVIQEHLLEFIKAPQADDIVSQRIDSCLECFKCVDVCPKDLNPLAFIGLAKFVAFQNQYEPYASAKPADYRAHYQSLNSDLDERQRSAVTKITVPTTSRNVFFPGCNVYKDSQRLLRIREILNRIDPDIAFLPGLEFCCGDTYIFEGRLDLGEDQNSALHKEIERINPEQVILWCPTCLAHIKTRGNTSVRWVSFFQFCLENMDKLDFVATEKKKIVTLHEPCKTAYTGLDQSHRDVIGAMPDIELREMPSGIGCCGSGGISYYKDNTINMISAKRLREAAETQADMLVTVCHYCQEVFDDINSYESLQIVNLADLMVQKLEDHGKI